MSDKIYQDPFYRELFIQYGFSFIVEAGFFFDSSKDNDPIIPWNILCTPLAFLKRDLPNPCILLSTGSFCPLHIGHIQMMEKAKEAVEKAGYQVAGGYFSPGHDEYILSKTSGKNWIPIHNRLQIIKEMIRDYDWLNVDPWEGVFNKVAVNFTVVIHRLEQYIQKHLNRHIPIFFVCGSDNANFAKTFKNQGHCVVVSRPPYTDQFNKYQINSNRIIFVEGGINAS